MARPRSSTAAAEEMPVLPEDEVASIDEESEKKSVIKSILTAVPVHASRLIQKWLCVLGWCLLVRERHCS